MYNIKDKIKGRFLKFLGPFISRIIDERLNKVSNRLAWLHYREMHLSRLNWLRTRICLGGGKIKVFFLVSYSAKFEYRSIYEEMEQSDLYEPALFIVHPRDRFFGENPSIFREAEKTYEEFKNRGYRCIFGYDPYGNPLFFDRFFPDIIFFDNPNLFMYSHYDNTYINGNYLTCFIPYFMDNSDLLRPERYGYRCTATPINSSWICFEESYYSHYAFTNTLKKENWPVAEIWSGENAVLAGAPKLDAYALPKDINRLPSLKLRNGKPIVIYAPHWSIRHDMSMSTFHLYGHKMLEYAKSHKEYNFVFKPHPELASHIKDMNGVGVRDFQKLKGDFDMTPGEYEEYIKEWDSLPNGVYISDGEYIELFRWSSVLITDSGSFIQEYLPSGHPCIYILNPEKANPLSFYGGVGLKILESYYCCSTWDKIEFFLKQLLVEKKDEKKHQRDLILKSDFVNLGSAGKFIVNYITSQLKGEMQ